MIPRIRRLQIRNFKSIERAVVDLGPLTVLVGPNGAGKSNLVDALLFLQQLLSSGLEQALRYRPQLLPEWVEADPKSDRHVGLDVELEFANGSRAEYAIELAWLLDDQISICHERCRVDGGAAGDAHFEVAEGRFIREIAGVRSQLSPGRPALFAASAAEEFRPVYDFLASIRGYSILPEEVKNLGRTMDSGLSLNAGGDNAATVLKAIIDRSPEDHARVVRLLSQAVEGIRDLGVTEFNGLLSLDFGRDVGRDDLGHFQSESMSDGTLRFLGLLLAIYQPSHPSVLLIEEPEATVHPSVAQLVTEVLIAASHDRQVLITTHSPDILDSKALSDDQIRVVSQRRGRTIVAPLAAASRQAIRERLYTPGELLRIDELEQDADQALAVAEGLEIFPPTAFPS